MSVEATYHTAGSAKLVKEKGLEDAAAIASDRAAQVFGLEILKPEIQDFSDNITRFLVVSRTADSDPLADKTTVVFSLPNEPGSLFKALSVFALREIDLTKIESRPIRGRPWDTSSTSISRLAVTISAARGHWCTWPSSRARCARSVRPELEGPRRGAAGVLTWRRCPSIAAAAPPSRRAASRGRPRDAQGRGLR